MTESLRVATARDEIPPFLVRTFVKVGKFHRMDVFDDGPLPISDEHQIFTWKDATLKEVLSTLRLTSPHVPEFRHPLARFHFQTVYADPQARGRFTSKELGTVYSRDILGEPGSMGVTAPRLAEDLQPPGRLQESMEDVVVESSSKGRDDNRTLDDLRFVPGDYLIVAILLPKSAGAPADISIKGAAGPQWKSGGRGGDGGWGGTMASDSAPSRGAEGGHWRGGGPPGRGGRGGGRVGDRDRDRPRGDRDRDYRRPPPPRGDRDTGRGRGRRPTRSRSPKRSRSRSFSRSRSSRSRSRSPRRRRYRD